MQKFPIETNMRFSLRNRDEKESFLIDSVRSKLDFFKSLEDMLVPALFTRNISYVMILSTRILVLIDGMINSI